MSKRSQKNVESVDTGLKWDYQYERKRKLYCICRKPYSKTDPTIGCDLCDDWFDVSSVDFCEE